MKSSENSDLQLIHQIATNNYLSYNKLFSRYYSPLCAYVYGMTHDKNDTEDIVQELFLNIWRNRHKLEIHTKVSLYLYKTARNLTLNHIRDNQKYRDTVDYSDFQDELSFNEETLELLEFRRALNDCINRLPERNKEILLMHRVKGLKQKEISELLDISVKTIKNQIWIAMQKLKNCLSIKGI